MPNIGSADADISKVHFDQQGSDPAAPADGWLLYFKSGGLYHITSGGAVTGPLVASGNGVDTAAIHDNESAEISAITEKTAPVAADLLLIEDSAASNAKKRVQLSNAGKGIKLDDLAAPDDNTDLNASTGAHGLLPKLNNSATNYLDGTGAWSTPAGTGFSNPMTTEGDLIKGGASGTPGRLAIGTDGYRLTSDGTNPAWEADYYPLEIILDGGGSAISTGIKGDIEVPMAGVIERVTMLADQSGSIVVDIWKDSYANYPPTDADSITAAAPPTISSAAKSQDSTLTGWTTTVAAGDILRFNVDSATTITRVTISLRVRKT